MALRFASGQISKEKAIKILRNQQHKLKILSYLERGAWVSNTAEYVRIMLGESSKQYEFIKDYIFWSVSFGNSDYQALTNNRKPELNSFIEGCIEQIEHFGLFKAPKQNVFSKYGNSIVIPILITAIGAAWSLGFLFGKQASDVNNIELRRENKSLKDTLLILRSTGHVPNNTAH